MKKIGLIIIPIMAVTFLTNCNNSITITWVNENGEILEIDKNVKKGDMPSYDSALPTKPWDDQNYYSFSGWSPEVTNVSKSQTYTATYHKIDMTGYGAYVKIEIPDYVDDLKFELFCEIGKTPTIDWGDGTVDKLSGHTYDKPGVYDIRIGGVNLINTWINPGYIKEVYFGPEITTIMQPGSGSPPFSGCAILSSIAIGKNVNYIDTWSFKNTPISSIVIDKDNCNYDSRDNCNAVITKKALDDGTPANTLIMGFKNSTIPAGVTSIGYSSFSGCTYLTSIVVPDGVTSICDFAFENCSSLASITLPNSLTSIGWLAFDSCYSLTSINIPDSVTDLDSAFRYCVHLTSVNIPRNIDTLVSGIFNYCLSLSFINIPSNIKSICSNAFGNCISLTSITIPNSVTLIEGSAFSDSIFLSSVDLSAYSDASTIPEAQTDAFFNCSPHLKFKVLNKEMADVFRNSDKGWPQDITKYTW